MIQPCCDEGDRAAMMRNGSLIQKVRPIARLGDGQRCLVFSAQFDVIDHAEFFRRVSDLLCMSNLAHASKLKEHDNEDDFRGSFRRAAERR